MASQAGVSVPQNLPARHIDSRYTFKEREARKAPAILMQYNMPDTGLLLQLRPASPSHTPAYDEVRTTDAAA
jgi:hypothetical protein